MATYADPKIAQLCGWLDSYITIAKAFLSKPDSYDLVLNFVSSPPEFQKFHCTTSDYRSLGMLEEEFYYNGPTQKNKNAALYCLRKQVLVPVITYTDFFAATLISVNPEYSSETPIGGTYPIKVKEVVVYEYVAKSGGQLSGALYMPTNWNPTNNNELVSKAYVDKLRLDIETRLGRLGV